MHADARLPYDVGNITFIMAEKTVIVPIQNEIGALGFSSEHTHDLIRQAQESDAADKQLTIKEAISKYKKACFWAMILSTSLIMEGYDLVIVSRRRKAR